MPRTQCPTCQAVLPRDEIEAGWCESCGKKLPEVASGSPRARSLRAERPAEARPVLVRFIDVLPVWLFFFVGLGLAVWGADEFRVSLGTSAIPAEVDLAALEKGQDPPQNHLRIGSHVRIYPGAIYSCKEKDKDLPDPPVDFVIYPILSPGNPFLPMFVDQFRSEDDPKKFVDMRLPPSDQLRFLVLTRKYARVSELPKRIDSRKSITGLVVNPIRSLEKKETEVLRQTYPEIDFSRTLILEEDRKPHALIGASLFVGFGGVLLLLAVIGFYRRVCVRTAA